MHKYVVALKSKPTRGQIMTSYRRSANKHRADQRGENHLDADTKYWLYNTEHRQELRQIFRRIAR